MKINKRNIANIALMLGMIFLVVGFVTDNTAFSWVAIGCIVISLIFGGRWMRRRKR